jgi:hypothetical protein
VPQSTSFVVLRPSILSTGRLSDWNWWRDSSLVLNILIAPRIHDVDNPDSTDVVVKHKDPHNDDGNRQPVANEENNLVFEAVSNVDGRDNEAGVGEDHGPPPQMEILWSRMDHLLKSDSGQCHAKMERTYSNEGDHEEPHSQDP